MKSFRKSLVFALVAVMLITGMSCGKADKNKEPEKESVQTEESVDTEKVEDEIGEDVHEETPEEELVEEPEEEESDAYSVFPEGSYKSMLLGEVGEDVDVEELDPYIVSVEIEDNCLVIQGSFKTILEEEEADSDETVSDDMDAETEEVSEENEIDEAEIIEFDTHRFEITDELEFYSAGGSFGAISITRDEFIELAHYYNGIGLVIEFQDGCLKKVSITS